MMKMKKIKKIKKMKKVAKAVEEVLKINKTKIKIKGKNKKRNILPMTKKMKN
jgi:hypothetical protein